MADPTPADRAALRVWLAAGMRGPCPVDGPIDALLDYADARDAEVAALRAELAVERAAHGETRARLAEAGRKG